MNTRYPLDQSPFYKLKSRAKLAELLGISFPDLNRIAAAQDAFYNRFPKIVGEKQRIIERPKPQLRQIQRRLVQLLNRIQPPTYIHSGFRGRSYITNARQHNCNSCLVKIDIRKFFPSAYAGYVFRAFQDMFQCSPDVAAVIMRLTTAFGHIPTGGNSSTIIAFFAFKPMFDEIYELAQKQGLVMSCCVDDMTFSGAAATSRFLNEVRRIVQRYGLKTHKRHCFKPNQAKIVTGVALTPKGIRLPNARRKKLHDALTSLERESDPFMKIKLAEELLGRATEAAQIEERFTSMVFLAAQKLNEARRHFRNF